MSGKLVFAISISLDGFVVDPDQTLEEPLGRGGEGLHEWGFGTRSFRERHGREGGDDGVDSDVLEETFRNVGATIMGRRMHVSYPSARPYWRS